MIAGRCPNINKCTERIDYVNIKKYPSECKKCKQPIRRMHLEEYMNNMEAITELVNRMKNAGKTCKLITTPRFCILSFILIRLLPSTVKDACDYIINKGSSWLLHPLNIYPLNVWEMAFEMAYDEKRYSDVIEIGQRVISGYEYDRSTYASFCSFFSNYKHSNISNYKFR